MENTLTDHLKLLEESHLKAEVRENKDKLAEILADGFVEIGSSGQMYGKDECLSLGVSKAVMVMNHFEITILAEDVVLTTYFVENKTSGKNSLRSSIWKFIDNRWQLFFHQGTFTLLAAQDLNNRPELFENSRNKTIEEVE